MATVPLLSQRSREGYQLPNRRLIDFIGIGAQKSATSWLHDVLSDTDGIEASDPKELNFFTANYDRGALWYEAQFGRVPAGAIRGECSPNYFISRAAPARAHSYNPRMKLIAVLRDPVERAFSNHLHEIRKGHIPDSLSFEEAMRCNPTYIEQGRYRANLTRWLKEFDREALLVLIAEDIANDPLTAFRQVCAHLGAAPDRLPACLAERSHESVGHKHAGVQRILRRGGDAARSMRLGGAVRAIKRAPVVDRLLALNRRDLRREIAPMREETRASLRELYREDIEFAAKLLGRSALPWKSWHDEVATEKRMMRDAV